MRYAIALEQGGWVVRDAITGRSETQPATSEEAQQAVAEWNARCVTRQVDPPIKIDGWGPAGELKVWLSRRNPVHLMCDNEKVGKTALLDTPGSPKRRIQRPSEQRLCLRD